jgi:hypothetical protein
MSYSARSAPRRSRVRVASQASSRDDLNDSSSQGIYPNVVEIAITLLFLATSGAAEKPVHLSMGLLVAPDTKSYQILGRVITQLAPRLNVMDLKTLDRAARLATPAVAL